MKTEAYLEGMNWEARFVAGEYLNAGQLKFGEAQKIAEALVSRINNGWANEGKKRKTNVSVTYDNLHHRFFIRAEVKFWGDGRITDLEVDDFQNRGKATALAVLKEVLETLKLAKRMALIRQALGWKDDGALTEVAIEQARRDGE